MNKKGFTLIEMLIVVAIVGLLASVVVLGIGNARERARDAKRAGDIRQIQNAAEAYYASNNFYPQALGGMAGVTTVGPNSDSYGWEPIGNPATGYKTGACMETSSFSSETNTLCPADTLNAGCAQVLCGGSQ